MSEPLKQKIHTSITVNRADGSVFHDIGSSTESEILECSLEGTENLARLSYPPVGRCIYCGKTEDLSREHIIPFGLRKYPGLLHRVEIYEDTERRCLIAEVQLFSNSETPSYVVILGQLKSKGH